jgi:ATP synthase protein I
MPPQDRPEWGKIAAVGFEVAIGVALGIVVGAWIDNKYKTSPWGVIIGLLLGFAGGMYLLIKDVLRMEKK